MGKLLISGNGKKLYSSVIMRIITTVTTLVFGVVMLFLADSNSSYDPRYPSLSRMLGRSETEKMFTAMAVVLLIMFIVSLFPLLMDIFRAKTKINVYENRIDGSFIEKSPFSLQDINISYEQISNIDVIKKMAVVIYTPYAKYKCYASNGAEIRDTILRVKENFNNVETNN